MSQENLAARAGVGVRVVRRAESGERIRIRNARRIVEFLQTTLERLQSDGPEVEAEALTIPLLHWDSSLSPGALLRADVHDGVPFGGREFELKELHEWCNASAPVSVKLVTGAGGMGKTRLLIELCEQLRKVGWAAGFTSDGVGELFRAQGKSLVVVDYADAALEMTQRVLAEAMHRRERAPIRIALIARQADEWWDHLESTGRGVSELLTGSATTFRPVLPFASSASDRLKAFENACTALARRLGLRVPAKKRPALTDRAYDVILYIHMAALAFIEKREVKDATALLDFVLLRERRDWTRRLKDRGFSARLAPAIATIVAAVVLLDGVKSEDDAIQLMQLEPRLEGISKADLYLLAGLLRAAYQGPKWLNKLQPDPVGDHLLVVDHKQRPGAAQNLKRAFTDRRRDS